MAYTQTIDEATPAGTDNASTADDQLRALKRDIKERLNSVFVDYNADPLVLKSTTRVRALNFENSSGSFVTFMSEAPIENAVDIGTNLYIRISTRPILAAVLDNNNKFYIESSTGPQRLIVHLNAKRYAINITEV